MQLLKNIYFIKVLKVILPLTILIVLYIEGKKQIQTIDFVLVSSKVQEIGIFSFIWIMLLGILAVSTMIFYDAFITKELRMAISKRKLLLQGFSANSYANFLGFGGFAGVGLRTVFYRKNIHSMPILIKRVTLILPYMLIGLSLFSWIVLIMEWISPIVLKDYPMLKLPLLFMCGYGVVIVAISYFTKSLNNKSQMLLVGISVLEWLFAAFLFSQIANKLGAEIPLVSIFVLFFLAAIAGALSMVPGGVGAFDFVILIGISSYGISEEKAIALLLLYRFVYYVVPFLLSSIFLVQYLTRERLWKHLLPNQYAFSLLCHRILTLWIVIVGVLLLLFPVVPLIIERVKLANQFMSMELMQITQQFSIAIGITLLVLARAIDDKVKRAYSFTFFILVIGTIVSLSKGFHIWEVVILIIAMILLFGSKGLFYRIASQYTIAKIIIDGFILISISTLYVLLGSIQIVYLQKIVPQRLQDFFSLHPQALLKDVIIGVLVSILLLYLGLYWKRNKKSASLFIPISIKNEKTQHDSALSKPIYVYTSSLGKIYYQKWMDLMIVDSTLVLKKDTIPLLKQFEAEIDLYGYALMIPLKEDEKEYLIGNNFLIYEEKGQKVAVSSNIPQIVAKSSLKWLVHYTKLVVR
ncbi:lysylphosphatidylglycerol synthase domain-containing protein [Sutcliffiella deserti]|uniref:lysylphosphatidylglycerol synthase domain-containing protein n=1 Tax=Sutcliffiella deserti TaxID=2875501 RepID=UPI001CBDEBCA|nr:lysylphosphatidylglycerol synthase domain-containing protein [Sutcliffiella deserti]